MKHNKRFMGLILAFTLVFGFSMSPYLAKAVELDEIVEYSVRYELRDEEGNLLELLQSETWEDWNAMEQSSVVTADILKEEYGNWDVEATSKGLTYVYTKYSTVVTPAEDGEDFSYADLTENPGDVIVATDNINGPIDYKPEEETTDKVVVTPAEDGEDFSYADLTKNPGDVIEVTDNPSGPIDYKPEEETTDKVVVTTVEDDTNSSNETDETGYSVRYELRDEEGDLLELLQSETWEDWNAMEQSSVVVADIFKEEYGNWDVEATSKGLTYVYTKYSLGTVVTPAEDGEDFSYADLTKNPGDVIEVTDNPNGPIDYKPEEETTDKVVATDNPNGPIDYKPEEETTDKVVVTPAEDDEDFSYADLTENPGDVIVATDNINGPIDYKPEEETTDKVVVTPAEDGEDFSYADLTENPGDVIVATDNINGPIDYKPEEETTDKVVVTPVEDDEDFSYADLTENPGDVIIATDNINGPIDYKPEEETTDKVVVTPAEDDEDFSYADLTENPGNVIEVKDNTNGKTDDKPEEETTNKVVVTPAEDKSETGINKETNKEINNPKTSDAGILGYGLISLVSSVAFVYSRKKINSENVL